jgi:caa(3)-type oxidase subunit IV
VPPATAAHGQATPGTYVRVALILALITAFEVAVMYVPHHLLPPRWTVLLVLLLLSMLKGGIVMAFFMHLRYDHRLYTGLFFGGLVVAAGTILALLVLFRELPAGMSAAAAMLRFIPVSHG